MKKLFFLLLLFVQHLSVFSQTQADYEHVVGRFKKFYNHNRSSRINAMFSDMWKPIKDPIWEKSSTKNNRETYGKMISYKYLGMAPSDSVMIFKTVYERSTHAMGITLDNKNKIKTFRQETSSPYIDSLLKASMK